MNPAQLINQTSGKTEYYTPQEIIEAARTVMGGIDLDPASSEAANARVKASFYFTATDDGLLQDWRGRIWLNHPFGRFTNRWWIKKLEREFMLEGHVAQACCITFACTSEAWFQPLLRRPQCFLHPRTNYLLPDGSVLKGVTKGSVVTYYGRSVTEFAKAFEALGVVKVRV